MAGSNDVLKSSDEWVGTIQVGYVSKLRGFPHST